MIIRKDTEVRITSIRISKFLTQLLIQYVHDEQLQTHYVGTSHGKTVFRLYTPKFQIRDFGTHGYLYPGRSGGLDKGNISNYYDMYHKCMSLEDIFDKYPSHCSDIVREEVYAESPPREPTEYERKTSNMSFSELFGEALKHIN